MKHLKTLVMSVAGLVTAAGLAFGNCGACGAGTAVEKTDKAECGATCKVEEKVQGAHVDTATLAVLVRAKVPMVVLDARSGKFDDGKRIPGARSLTAGATEAEIAAVVSNKDALVITYCGGPSCPASQQLAERLVKLGYLNVVEYPDGMPGWVKAGQTVEDKK